MNFQSGKLELIFSELSYKINGCAYKVHNELGGGHLEKVYQKAMAIEFERAGLKFLDQKQVAIMYFNSKISSSVPDFIVEEKVVVDLKRKGRLLPDDFDQVRKYLKSLDMKLSLLHHFGKECVMVKRVVNL